MTGFLASMALTIVMILVVIQVGRTRPKGTPLTWGEAMFAAVYVFFLLFWIYGVVPHQWLTWADNELRWRPDKIFLQPRAKPAACSWT